MRKYGQPTVYHYPRSRSSFGAIRLLEACMLQPKVVDITLDRLLARDIERFMEELGISHPRDFMRTHDPLYTELKLDNPELSRHDLIQALLDHPRLMKRPVVDFPYRENGQKKREWLIAQPPQRLFMVLYNESEEEALGLAPAKEEAESPADRWAREWSQAEGQYRPERDPEEMARLREVIASAKEYDFPEETDEMADGERAFTDEGAAEYDDDEDEDEDDDDVEDVMSKLDEVEDEDDAELLAGLKKLGFGRELLRRPPSRTNPELRARTNAIIVDMAKRAVAKMDEEDEYDNPAKRRGLKASAAPRRGGQRGVLGVTEEELGELFARLLEAEAQVAGQTTHGSRRRRLPVPPVLSRKAPTKGGRGGDGDGAKGTRKDRE